MKKKIGATLLLLILSLSMHVQAGESPADVENRTEESLLAEFDFQEIDDIREGQAWL